MRGTGYKDLKNLKKAVTNQKGPEGRSLCVWCHREVPKGRHNWCSEECVHTYRLQADWTYICQLVETRDKGICSLCGLDTRALRVHFDQIIYNSGLRVLYETADTYKIPKG